MASVSAPVLSQQQVARSLKAKTNKPVKNTLCTPYKVLWSDHCLLLYDFAMCNLT